jgi:hypothetical protein
MKKLLIVLSALVLTVAFTVPALAVDADWTGELGFGGITSFDEEKKSAAFTDAYFDAHLNLDQYNEIIFELNAELAVADVELYDTDLDGQFDDGMAWYGVYWEVGALKLVTDVGEYAGLPVGLKATAGWFGYDSKEFGVTGHAWERKYRPGTGTAPATLFELDFGMAQLGVDVTWEEGALTQDYAALLATEVGPAALEVSAWVIDNDDFDMVITANAEAEGLMDMIDVAAGVGFETADVPTYADWWWGFGAKVTYSMLELGASINGDEAYTIDKLGIDAKANLLDDAGIEVGLGLNLDTDRPTTNDETLGGFSVSAFYEPGASTWTVGYLFCKDGMYDYAAPTLSPAAAYDEKGGLFLKYDLDI